MDNFVKPGKSIGVTASGAVVGGVGYDMGEGAGVAAHDAANGEALEVLLEGIVTLACKAEAKSIGDKLYWDTADGNVQKTDDSGTNECIGWAVQAVASSATTVRVKLGWF